jgi:hypothetical protein
MNDIYNLEKLDEVLMNIINGKLEEFEIFVEKFDREESSEKIHKENGINNTKAKKNK